MCETSDIIGRITERIMVCTGSNQYTSNKSEAEIKFPETTSSKNIKLSEIDNENISAGRIMTEIDFFLVFTAYLV